MRALLLAGLLVPMLAQASALERFQEFLRGTQSARASFEQKVYDRQRRLVQESNGTFSFLRPGRFRWRYAQPYEQVIVGDGERVWIHDPDLNQVTVRPMARALGSTPAALLAGSTDVERAFEFAEGGTADGLEWLEAKPRGEDSGFERIRLGLNAQGVQAMQLTDHFGQTTELRFSALVRNPPLAPDDFRFVPPKGADVLGQ
ncbi:MAG: outer membrane lipoprotein chaperone LolA [Betaproteobacteria bacterium]|nr:outer membrane lipoprotein chaperone LolA [Betaproteobacteria bacterium]MDH4326726.1 outer membrane lipoprotein chaperone LolA [Betaproteobacteria bacterium]